MQRPLVYQWIARYENGTGWSQFDPKTYTENPFSIIEQDKLKKFGLYPLTRELEEGLRKNNIETRAIPFLPKYEINIDKNKRLIYYRDVFISHENYHLCKNCNKEYFYGKNSPKLENTKYSSPICPNCGSHDLFVCKNCKKEFKRFEDAKFQMCDCGAHLNRIRITSGQYSRERRWIEYYLGYQTIVKGANTKFLLKIDERGDSIII